jgi:hypothetical protein
MPAGAGALLRRHGRPTACSGKKLSLGQVPAGSGTALIAAEVTGRVYYALELEPTYCDVVARWELLTGQMTGRTS